MTNETKAAHTPGPWEVAHGGGSENGRYVVQEAFVRRPGDDVAIASDICDPETCAYSDANAALIAAAPDLLEALEEQVGAFDRQVAEYRRNDDEAIARISEQVHGKRMDRARLAIAKARGGS